TIVHDDLLPPTPAHFCRDHAREYVGRSAGRELYDDANRLGWILGRRCAAHRRKRRHPKEKGGGRKDGGGGQQERGVVSGGQFLLPPSSFRLAVHWIMPLHPRRSLRATIIERPRKKVSRMPDRELWRLPAVELSALIGRKEVSPVELLDMFLQRCERLNPVLNAIIAFDREGARRAAEAAGRLSREGPRLRPLDGLPVTIKNNILVEGFTARGGSLLYRVSRPPQDDIAVARLRAAGAVIFGRTNTPEFALQSFTD